jgi:GNAT superfamily N-acetyltransferase
VTTCTFSVITPFTAAPFAGLTFATYGRELTTFDPACTLVAIGAEASARAVGLVIGRLVPPDTASVLSLFVVPDFRRAGIGSALLQELERACAERGHEHLDLSYALDTKGSENLERCLSRCGWALDGRRVHIFTVDGKLMQAAWFDQQVVHPPYAIEPWSTVTEADREELSRSQTADRWIPDYLVPFRFEDSLEALNSLVLRHDGVVRGWLLTSRISAHVIRYENIFVRPSLNRTGRALGALALIAEAVRRQAHALGVESHGRFEVLEENVPLLRFIDRHMREYVLKSVRMQRLTKTARSVSTGSLRRPGSTRP